MAIKNTNSKKGFTIIEVVLVLAIAGLIFLMVFIAYPALRRSQSDTQRRNDFSRFISQLSQYKANNRSVPQGTDVTALKKFRNTYLDGDFTGETSDDLANTGKYSDNDKFTDPDGEFYLIIPQSSITGTGAAAAETNVTHKLYYYNKAKCKGEDVITSEGKNDVAIQYRMENGVYCGTNAE